MNIQNFMLKSIGKKVAYSRTGGGDDSFWVIEFEDSTSYTIGCSWRMTHNGAIITTSYDDATALEGNLNENAEKLVGNKLLSYKVSEYHDLTLYFENGFVVSAFCDVIERDSEEDAIFYANWKYTVPDQNIAGIITGQFKLVYIRYTDNTVINPDYPSVT